MDYVPRKDSDFAVWSKNFLSYTQARLTAFNMDAFQPLPPATDSEYDVDTSIPSRCFWDEAGKRHGKPKEAHGAEVRWELRGGRIARERRVPGSAIVNAVVP
jgi:hypothetical protein